MRHPRATLRFAPLSILLATGACQVVAGLADLEIEPGSGATSTSTSTTASGATSTASGGGSTGDGGASASSATASVSTGGGSGGAASSGGGGAGGGGSSSGLGGAGGIGGDGGDGGDGIGGAATTTSGVTTASSTTSATTGGGDGGAGGAGGGGGVGGAGGASCDPDACPDGAECFEGTCDPDGDCAVQPAAPGATCDAGFCDGAGTCLPTECDVPGDCPPIDCDTNAGPSCDAAHQCVYVPRGDGAPCPAGVCQGLACVACIFDTDCEEPACREAICNGDNECVLSDADDDTPCDDGANPGVCDGGTCATCRDFEQNGNETAIDCGGPDCGGCLGDSCVDNDDCAVEPPLYCSDPPTGPNECKDCGRSIAPAGSCPWSFCMPCDTNAITGTGCNVNCADPTMGMMHCDRPSLLLDTRATEMTLGCTTGDCNDKDIVCAGPPPQPGDPFTAGGAYDCRITCNAECNAGTVIDCRQTDGPCKVDCSDEAGCDGLVIECGRNACEVACAPTNDVTVRCNDSCNCIAPLCDVVVGG